MSGDQNDSEMKELLTVHVKDENFQGMSGTVQDALFMNELGTQHTQKDDALDK